MAENERKLTRKQEENITQTVHQFREVLDDLSLSDRLVEVIRYTKRTKNFHIHNDCEETCFYIPAFQKVLIAWTAGTFSPVEYALSRNKETLHEAQAIAANKVPLPNKEIKMNPALSKEIKNALSKQIKAVEQDRVSFSDVKKFFYNAFALRQLIKSLQEKRIIERKVAEGMNALIHEK